MIVIHEQGANPVHLYATVKGKNTDFPYVSGMTAAGERVRFPVFHLVSQNEWRLSFTFDVHSPVRPYKPKHPISLGSKLFLFPNSWCENQVRSFLRGRGYEGTQETAQLELASGSTYYLHNLVTATPLARG